MWRNIAWLAAMIALALVYALWLASQGTITGTPRGDGVLGVVLGLYIGSHPAANALDLLLFRQAAAREALLKMRTSWLWLGLNVLVLFAAWFVIFLGVTRFVIKST